MLDHKLLESLAMVVQEKGFDKAAQRLNITQSAISQRIKQLEEQTGQVVIARTNPPKATKAGQQMVKHYLQIKRLEEDLFDSITPNENRDYVALAIGTNRDSLSTWLSQAVQPFLRKRKVVLEFHAADQEQTHQLMKDGDVIGCISVKNQAMQGCKVSFLGRMKYRLVATPEFAGKWFSKGVNRLAVSKTPLVCFDRKDEMHQQFFQKYLKLTSFQLPIHYVPSTQTYATFILNGLAYGLLPEQECEVYIQEKKLKNLLPEHPVFVDLYWHHWNLKSKLLEEFSQFLVHQASHLLHQY